MGFAYLLKFLCRPVKKLAICQKLVGLNIYKAFGLLPQGHGQAYSVLRLGINRSYGVYRIYKFIHGGLPFLCIFACDKGDVFNYKPAALGLCEV